MSFLEIFVFNTSSFSQIHLSIIATLVVAHCAIHVHMARTDWIKALLIAVLLAGATMFTGVTLNSIAALLEAQPMFAIGTFSLGLSVCCFATWATRRYS